MKFIKLLLVFLVINFSALGLGIWLMGDGPTSDWYTSLQQAPWTPANWVFGAAWTAVMLCFSMYMTLLYLKEPSTKIVRLFIIQFLLNVVWNFVFFNQQHVALGMLVITALTLIITAFLVTYFELMKFKNLLLLPYVVWICIATSLNLYILIYN